MKALLLAAGKATRFRPITDSRPKGAVPLLNTPLMYYPLFFLENFSLSGLAVNIHYHGQQVRELVTGLGGRSYPTFFSDESKSLLGSGGGIKKAEGFLKGGDNFLVANGDEVIFAKSRSLPADFLRTHSESNVLATLLVMDHPGVGGQFGGVWVDKENFVLDFGLVAPPEAAKGYHFVGVQVISDKVFDLIPEEKETNIFYDIYKQALARGLKVKAFPIECTWYETGNPKDFLKATEDMVDLYETLKGTELGSRLSQWNWSENVKEGRLILGKNSVIDSKAQLKGFNVIGAGAEIHAEASIENCVVGPGISIQSGAVHRDKIIL